jgi:hypothetical protein
MPPATVTSGDDAFTVDDLVAVSELVAQTWTAAADRDWSVPAGTVDWTCLHTADHAVDCVWAPALFLASRRTDGYPDAGLDATLGERATPTRLVEALGMATRILAAVVRDATPATRAVLFRRPAIVLGRPADFAPRGALELILHGHDVAAGLAMPFEPPADTCRRLRDHTRPWPLWTVAWNGLPDTDDPWADLLHGAGRRRQTL